jgi:3-dehydroquinate dehydratase-2
LTLPVYVLNGPNLNLLGEREPHIYGHETLADVEARCERAASAVGLEARCFQSNHEGQLIDWVHEARKQASAIVINPAGLTFTSIALLDSLKAFDKPKMEVHISNPHARESYYHSSFISKTAHGVIAGLGPFGYECAIQAISQQLSKP